MVTPSSRARFRRILLTLLEVLQFLVFVNGLYGLIHNITRVGRFIVCRLRFRSKSAYGSARYGVSRYS
jgi:hypothetical protein